MKEDLQLAGFSPKTQQSYLGAVRGLAKHYMRSPDNLSEEEIRQFFLHLVNERKSARSTVTIYLCGIKFFFETTLQRQWNVFSLVRPTRVKKLPVVLSREEVRRILPLIRKTVNRVALTLIYSCGLRVSEGARLRIEDIDCDRQLLWVRDSKRGKDRSVSLSEPTLAVLKEYRGKVRPKEWLFPGGSENHVSIATLQRAFKAALVESGITKKASVHSLRHSYATHLLENGVDIRIIQGLLGHESLETTHIYTHLTEKTTERFLQSLNHLMTDL